ncbi:MAG: hypothetical protein ABSG22_03135 [Sedimentisphaerales bacterium]
MNGFDIKNFKESAKWFLCANTPVYLYTNLKKLSEIEGLSNILSVKDIYEKCKHILEKSERNQVSELMFYIFLMALSFKEYSEAHTFLGSLRNDKYKWANSIISLIIGKYNPITEYKTTVKYEPKVILSQEGFENPTTSSDVTNVYVKDSKNA